jgi:integrase
MNWKLFNEEQKKRFLDEKYPNESTRSSNASILRNVGRFEYDKNKDVSKFNYEEVKEVLIGLMKKTNRSMNVSYTIIMQYLDWCVDKKYIPINILTLVDKKDKKKYVSKVAQKNSYITREQLYDYCSQLYNYIDKAMLVLLFEGVKGRSSIEHSFEELRNFKMTDILENNIIIATRDFSDDSNNNIKQRRLIPVDPRTIEILLTACKENTYHKANGEAKGRFAIMPVKDSPYVIRTIDRSGTDDDRISVSNICSRFKNFRQYIGIKFLNPTLVFQSGMFDRCLKLEDEIGELQAEDFRQLFRNLNLDERNWSGLKEMYESYKQIQTKSIVPL